MRAGEVGDPATIRAALPRRQPPDAEADPLRLPQSPLTSRHVRVLEYVPQLSAPPSGPTRTLLHLPGGAYTKPADPRHFAFVRDLADRLGMRALVALYDLAPEHTWRDSRPALVDLVSRARGRSRADGVVLSGDSAGAGYALSVAQGVRDAGGVLPTRLVLVSPWLDLTPDVPGREEAARDDPWLTLPFLHVYAGWWAGSEADRALPEVSPARGDLHGLPPTLDLLRHPRPAAPGEPRPRRPGRAGGLGPHPGRGRGPDPRLADPAGPGGARRGRDGSWSSWPEGRRRLLTVRCRALARQGHPDRAGLPSRSGVDRRR